MKILVIPDSHARPEVSNRRYDALGNFITDKKPDIIVDIGDFADMGSLSAYDKGNVHAEGKRYVDDIAAANNALARIMKPVNHEVDRLIRGRRKRWEPKFYHCGGNHDDGRINRAQVENPSMYGAIGLDDLDFKKWGWTCVPFLQPLNIENIAFQHYFTSGVMARPIGGENHAASLVKKGYMSCVAGHSHMRDYWETTDVVGRKRFGLVVGCFDEGNHHYTSEQDRWWSGVYMLHDVEDGQCEPVPYNMKYMLENYL